MQRMRAATGYSAPIPRLPVQPCRGSQRLAFSGMAVYNCAIAPTCEQYLSSQPSRTIVHVSPPKYVALQLHFSARYPGPLTSGRRLQVFRAAASTS